MEPRAYAFVSGRAMASHPHLWSGVMSLENDPLPRDGESRVKRSSGPDGTRLPGLGGGLLRERHSLVGVGPWLWMMWVSCTETQLSAVLEWTPGLTSQSVIFRGQRPRGQGPLIVFRRCGPIHGPVFMGPKMGQNPNSEPDR